MDIDLIKQCADDRLQPAIVEKFLDAVGAEPLSVRVTIDGKTVLIPKIETAIQAADVVATYHGRADVRFGIAQVPAGIGPVMATGIDETMFEPCKNLHLGSQIFAGIYDALGQDWPNDQDGRFEAAVAAYDPKPQRQSENSAPKDSVKKPSSQTERPNLAETRVDLGRLEQPTTGSGDVSPR